MPNDHLALIACAVLLSRGAEGLIIRYTELADILRVSGAPEARTVHAYNVSRIALDSIHAFYVGQGLVFSPAALVVGTNEIPGEGYNREFRVLNEAERRQHREWALGHVWSDGPAPTLIQLGL